MAKETVLSNLNVLTFKTQKGFQNHVDEIGEFDLVLTPDQSLKGTLLDFKWADHILNDMSWLRADDFSWHGGDVYVAAYEHLVADFEGTAVETETIDDITIAFYRAEDGHKICLPDQESNISALYEAIGSADYYLLDIGNKQFKLPRKYKPKRELIKAVKNSDNSWYNLYSDGWVEQGGNHDRGSGGAQVNLLIRMSHQYYDVQLTSYNAMRYAAVQSYTDSYFTVVTADDSTANNDYPVHWQVSGYAHESELINIINQPFEYYYVGNFEQSAVEQTAGLNAELFNGKADVNLNNINPSNSAKEMIVGWGMPDYTAGVALSDITPSNPYTATIDCVIYGTAYNGAVYVNGNIVAYADGTNYAFPITIILPKGDIITTTATKISRVYMIPLKGVN